jgi:radical SAM-linked protein
MIHKFRMTFSKTGTARYLSHLEMVRLFIRACRRAGLSLVYSKGYHPLPKVAFTAALPVGMESIQETVDIKLYEPGHIALLKEKLGGQLPPGIEIDSVEDVTHRAKRPRLKESHFYITMDGLKIERCSLEAFLKSEHFPIVRIGKKGEQLVDARPLVKSLNHVPPYEINLVINHISGPTLKPAEIIKGIFHLKDHQVGCIKILKTGQVMD